MAIIGTKYIHITGYDQGVGGQPVVSEQGLPLVEYADLHRTVAVLEWRVRRQHRGIWMRSSPVSPRHMWHGDQVQAFSFQWPLDGLAVQMSPQGPGLAVYHGEDVLKKTEDLEGEGLAVHHGVEPDPRTALYSVGYQDRFSRDTVVDDVVEVQHPYGVGAGLVVPHQAEDQVVTREIGRLLGGQKGGVVQGYEGRTAAEVAVVYRRCRFRGR